MTAAGATQEPDRIVVVYQRPATQELHFDEATQRLSYITKSDVSGLATDSKFYVGEKSWAWVSRLEIGASADAFEAALDRVPNDAVYRMRVVRDYTKGDRREAPLGIDKAEAAAAAGAEK